MKFTEGWQRIWTALPTRTEQLNDWDKYEATTKVYRQMWHIGNDQDIEKRFRDDSLGADSTEIHGQISQLKTLDTRHHLGYANWIKIRLSIATYRLARL